MKGLDKNWCFLPSSPKILRPVSFGTLLLRAKTAKDGFPTTTFGNDNNNAGHQTLGNDNNNNAGGHSFRNDDQQENAPKFNNNF